MSGQGDPIRLALALITVPPSEAAVSTDAGAGAARRGSVPGSETPVARPDSSVPAGSPPAPSHAEIASVFRLLRRLGVPDADVDDATQQVFLVVAARSEVIEPDKLRAFVFGVALRVARHLLSRIDTRTTSLDEARSLADDVPSTEELVDQRKARALLDAILDEMPFELRTVFVLFELEQLSLTEIARALELKRGTVASRLRRAREEFQRHVANRAPGKSTRGGRP